MGGTVTTVGFPNIGLQGFAPKLAKGEIAALSGAQDDSRYFQISAPVQPGNSGGALVDERGNVVGVVAAKLSAAAAVATSGALPENVNYAVKSSLLLSFLESVPEVAAKLKEPNTKDRKFEDVVKSAEQAAVLEQSDGGRIAAGTVPQICTICPGVWTFAAELPGGGQPAGLPEGSRWSLGAKGERPPENRVGWPSIPERGARALET
jgi:S1-C subfamily serine protease